MPVTYSIDVARKLIRTSCTSPLTYAEVIAHFHALSTDPLCSGYLDVLLDVSAADALPTSDQLGAVSAELGAIRQKVQFGFCAIIAVRDAMFGMMRMFEVFAGPYFRKIRVFRGAVEAEDWLVAEQSEDGAAH